MDEEHQLDLLSDLAGYPESTSFRPYLTGYPCGRFYVVARTWPDLKAERAGTVWTHSLLLPLANVDSLQTLDRVVSLHHEPRHPIDPSRWKKSLDSDLFNTVRTETPPETLRQHLVASWFEDRRRPVVWADDKSADSALFWLWRLLPPASRPSFTFCTGVMQARFYRESPLAWQAIEPSMLRHFGEPLRAACVVEPGQPARSLDLAAPLAAPDSAVAEALWGQARERGFNLARWSPGAILRYERLRADNTLPSTLAAIDLVRAFGGAGQERDYLVKTWLSRTPRAGEPDTLIDRAYEVLARDPASFAPEMREALADWLVDALSVEVMDQRPQRLRPLYDVAGPFRPVLADPIVTVLIAQEPALLVEAIQSSPELINATLSRLQRPARAGVARLLLDSTPNGDAAQLQMSLVSLAEALDDLEMLAAVSNDAAYEALNAMGRTFQREPDTRAALRLSRQFSPDTLLRWATTGVDGVRPIDTALFRVIREALEGSRQPPPSFVELADEIPLPQRLDLAAHWGFAEVRAALGEDAATRVWTWLQVGEPQAGTRGLANDTLDALPADMLLSATQVDAASWWNADWSEVAFEKLAYTLLTRRLEGGPDDQFWSHWKDTPLAAMCVKRASGRTLRLLANASSVHDALALLASPTFRGLDSERPTVFREILDTLASRPAPEPWASEEQWIEYLEKLPRPVSVEVATVLLFRCIRTPVPEGSRLAGKLFPLVHVALRKNQHSFIERAFSYIESLIEGWVEPWDKAKRLRKPFIAAWARAGWPPETLFVAADGDEKTFEWLIEAVDDLPASRVLMKSLYKADLPNPSPEWLNWQSRLKWRVW